jgi:hypothetical protein
MKKVHICYTQNQTLQIFYIRRKMLQKLNSFAYVHVKTNIKNQTLQTLRMYIKSFLTSARKDPETNSKNPIQNFYTDEGQRKSNTSPKPFVAAAARLLRAETRPKFLGLRLLAGWPGSRSAASKRDGTAREDGQRGELPSWSTPRRPHRASARKEASRRVRPQISSTTIPKTRARFAWKSTRCSAPLWWRRAGRRAGSGGLEREGLEEASADEQEWRRLGKGTEERGERLVFGGVGWAAVCESTMCLSYCPLPVGLSPRGTQRSASWTEERAG